MASYEVQTEGGTYQVDTAPEQGVLESAGRAAVNNIPLAPQVVAGGEAALTGSDYSKNLEEWNQKATEAKAQHPIAYGAGAVTGAVAPAFIPVVGEAAATIPGGAVLGGLNAISNKDLTKDPEETLKQAAIGAGIGGATSGILSKAVPAVLSKFARSATSPEAVEAVTKNPSLLNSPDTTQMAEDMPKVMKAIQDKIDEAAEKARGLLSKSYYPPDMGVDPTKSAKAISKSDVADLIHEARKDLGVYGGGIIGSSAKKAVGVLNDLEGDIQNIGRHVGGTLESQQGVPSIVKKNQFLPETTVKDILQRLDDNINWDDETGKVSNQALEKVRVALDTQLKKQNPAYAEAMKPVDQGMRLLQSVKKAFALSQENGEYIPRNATAGNIANALKDRNLGTQRVLDEMKNYGVADLEPQLLAQQFKGPTPENPIGPTAKIAGRIGGGLIGAGLGGTPGGFGGMFLGRMLAKPISTAARNVAGKIVTNPEAIQTGTQRMNQLLNDYLTSLYKGKKQ